VPKPYIAARRPVTLELQPGTYRWCSCGRSENQPWCDDSHQGSEFEPIVFTITERKRVSMCQCKHTTKPPFCSGVHGDIPW
jgi:CDGSH-type Zn-finger protein